MRGKKPRRSMGCTVEGQEGLAGFRRFRMADLAVITDCYIRIMAIVKMIAIE